MLIHGVMPQVLATGCSVSLAASTAPAGPISPILDTDIKHVNQMVYPIRASPFRAVYVDPFKDIEITARMQSDR